MHSFEFLRKQTFIYKQKFALFFWIILLPCKVQCACHFKAIVWRYFAFSICETFPLCNLIWFSLPPYCSPIGVFWYPYSMPWNCNIHANMDKTTHVLQSLFQNIFEVKFSQMVQLLVLSIFWRTEENKKLFSFSSVLHVPKQWKLPCTSVTQLIWLKRFCL